MSIVTPDLLLKLTKAAPRYTSYPTAPEWNSLLPGIYSEKLEELGGSDTPLSLYFHIPFCKTMCLFCGCSVILNRKPENEERYVEFLLKEIDLVCSHFQRKKKVTQLHFGGGTPTKLSLPLLEKLFLKITSCFDIDFQKEIAIEIDPRTVFEDRGEKLQRLRDLGFNRVSFGVQDTNPEVQEAIKRRQTMEMTTFTYQLARSLNFQGINLDLIYGLPLQTPQSFQKTIEEIISLKPDRIALFSYAKVPWLKAHQKAIFEEDLPSTREKFEIYSFARKRLIQEGYVGIGMDHFALENDDLAKSYRNQTLQRNFQGYTVRLAEDHLGFGVTAIGYAKHSYFQNHKELQDYYTAIEKQELPVHRGKVLSEEDRLRKWVIHTLMCTFSLHKKAFSQRFGLCFDEYFQKEKSALKKLEEEGLLEISSEKLQATPTGELFIRNIVMTFDAYLSKSDQKFSQSV